ncbi:hypothetical protein DICPUDRAFT_158756 [Dictyostelium purpureum]|uniref:G-protein coupled receptors family 2 profile 2 domain-containing protein n=1 Tax=Dictyostelium purpureum TaxID=5786 RepID=F1A2E5_DICPU|nr:uncharacterized protein DICPUDRAFT_158756 [Dictyostelium purpureum]EGC29636.1 hypothetical protein DICPUDRAFT_158756 [Dictyostelium purpureum]|eukprot:XP_003293840.1 hypothetical protein DICPUDRAFT_158756 [Dictyostelium purpureum]
MGIQNTAICNPTGKEFLSVDILNIVTASLSLIGSALTVISYIYKQVRTYRSQVKIREQQIQNTIAGGTTLITSGQFKQPQSKLPFLIFMLSVADFFTSVFIIISQSYLINNPESYSRDDTGSSKIHFSPCILFRAIIQFFFLSTFFWTTCISYYLYHQLSSPGEEKYLITIFNIISWGIPLTISLVITLTNSIVIDPTGWCEVKKPMEFSLWFLPLFLCLVVCSIYYIRLRKLFRSKFEYRLQINDRLKQLDSTISRRLTLYIIVFIICWLPDVIQHFISFFSTCTFFPLLILQNILTPSQGFWNFWVYSFTNKVVGIQKNTQGNDENKRLLS